jgi:hypothetical protein
MDWSKDGQARAPATAAVAQGPMAPVAVSATAVMAQGPAAPSTVLVTAAVA